MKYSLQYANDFHGIWAVGVEYANEWVAIKIAVRQA